jgi:hypothetical protein
MKNLGYLNSWSCRPEIVKECQEKDHKIFHKKDPQSKCVTILWCPKCRYQYRIDSSD